MTLALGLWRSNTFSSAKEISPTLALARAASIASVQKIGVARRAFGQRVERGLRRRLVALGAQALELGDLRGAHGGIVDLQHIRRDVVVGAEFVHADDDLLCRVSMRACVFAATSSMRCLGRPAAIALAMPPRLSISSICVQAASASSAVSFST